MSKVAALRAMREAKHTGKPRPKVTLEDVLLFESAESADDLKAFMADAAYSAKLLGSKGGKSKSPAKQEAARSNGKKGGKPKRLG